MELCCLRPWSRLMSSKELGVSSALFTAEALRDRAAAVHVESDLDIPIDLSHVKALRANALMGTEEGR
jgi:hypothetical protein